MNLFFTADWHLFHDFMLRGIPGQRVPRPMFSSVEEMNETIVENHNEVVRPGDLVYNLGDFAVKTQVSSVLPLFKRLNGNQYFVRGNHDAVGEKLPWIWIKDLANLSPKIEGVPHITLCHYALRTWPSSHKGTFQLYGHSHSMLPEDPTLLSFDVGVDVPEWNFHPVSIEQVMEKMARKMPAWLEYRESLKGSGRVE